MVTFIILQAYIIVLHRDKLSVITSYMIIRYNYHQSYDYDVSECLISCKV